MRGWLVMVEHNHVPLCPSVHWYIHSLVLTFLYPSKIFSVFIHFSENCSHDWVNFKHGRCIDYGTTLDFIKAWFSAAWYWKWQHWLIDFYSRHMLSYNLDNIGTGIALLPDGTKTCWSKMAAISQMTFSNTFSLVKIFKYAQVIPKGPVDNISALVQLMAWCQTGNRPLSEPTVA